MLNPPENSLFCSKAIKLVLMEFLNLFLSQAKIFNQLFEIIEVFVPQLIINKIAPDCFFKILIFHKLSHYSTKTVPCTLHQIQIDDFIPEEVTQKIRNSCFKITLAFRFFSFNCFYIID